MSGSSGCISAQHRVRRRPRVEHDRQVVEGGLRGEPDRRHGTDDDADPGDDAPERQSVQPPRDRQHGARQGVHDVATGEPPPVHRHRDPGAHHPPRGEGREDRRPARWSAHEQHGDGGHEQQPQRLPRAEPEVAIDQQAEHAHRSGDTVRVVAHHGQLAAVVGEEVTAGVRGDAAVPGHVGDRVERAEDGERAERDADGPAVPPPPRDAQRQHRGDAGDRDVLHAEPRRHHGERDHAGDRRAAPSLGAREGDDPGDAQRPGQLRVDLRAVDGQRGRQRQGEHHGDGHAARHGEAAHGRPQQHRRQRPVDHRQGDLGTDPPADRHRCGEQHRQARIVRRDLPALRRRLRLARQVVAGELAPPRRRELIGDVEVVVLGQADRRQQVLRLVGRRPRPEQGMRRQEHERRRERGEPDEQQRHQQTVFGAPGRRMGRRLSGLR